MGSGEITEFVSAEDDPIRKWAGVLEIAEMEAENERLRAEVERLQALLAASNVCPGCDCLVEADPDCRCSSCGCIVEREHEQAPAEAT